MAKFTNVKGSLRLHVVGIPLLLYMKIRKKLDSLQILVRTTRRTKTANITKDDVTSASHSHKVTVLQK